jgi:Na+-driven multidrug efflux pump
MLKKESPELRIEMHKLKIHWDILKRIAYIGIPAGIQGMIFNFSNVMIQGGINSLGTAAVAANTVSLNFDYFCFFIGNAFGQAGTSFMSQNYGAKQIDRCKRIIRNVMIIGPGTTLIVSWIFILFAQQLASVFTSDPEVIRLAVIRSQIVLAIYGIHSFNEIMSGILRSLGYAVIPAWINIVFICGVRLLWLFFFFPMKPEMGFLMYCYPISWIVNIGVLMPIFFILVHRTLRKASIS